VQLSYVGDKDAAEAVEDFKNETPRLEGWSMSNGLLKKKERISVGAPGGSSKQIH
jgi:hypothetical protein